MSCNCPSHGSRRAPDHVRFKRTASRRDILKAALGGAGIMALGPMVGRLPLATGSPSSNKIFILIYMDGGCDTLNTVVPDGLSSYFTRRPTIAVPSASSLALNGTSLYKLHPNLDGIQSLYNSPSQDVALIQRVGYPNENLSHFESQDFYAQAVRNGFGPLGIPESGWIARYADLYAPTPMGAVSIRAGHPTAFVGGSSNPLQIGSLASFNFGTDNTYQNNDAYRKLQVQQILAGASTAGAPGEVRAAIDQAYQLSGQIQTARTNYNTYLAGTNIVYSNRAPSSAMKDIAALIYGGFETRVFYTTYGGFDTHGDEGSATGQHATLMGYLDDAIQSFQADMTNMVKWQDIVIAVYTEFGRRNYENNSLGTDHGAGQSVILAGGAVNGGLYGPLLTNTDLNGEYVNYAVDFRDIWKEIVADHLSANPAPVFPEAQPINQTLGVV